MHINNIGYNHVHDADLNIYRPKGSGDYLFLLLKTAAIFMLNGDEVITQKNSFMLYRKGTPQYYRAYGAQFANDWFHFDLSEEELNFIESLDIPFDQVEPIGDINDLSLIIKNMCFERYSTKKHKETSIDLYMKLLFLKLSDKFHSPNENNPTSYYNKMSIIRTNIYNMPYYNWNVEGMAHQFTMCKSYFQHLYKEIFGTNVMNDVIQSRIEHAKYLLSTTDISIIQIAEISGYKCSSHFMRQFKSRIGMTPSEYRNRLSHNAE